jgi:hypothetical protein
VVWVGVGGSWGERIEGAERVDGARDDELASGDELGRQVVAVEEDGVAGIE